jgi:cysteine sulfinate desulfinase/cysteine desulfurase-like protein
LVSADTRIQARPAMHRIYLDNNATTALHPAVLEAMLPFLRGDLGNPSSLHREGNRARRVLEAAREQVAHLLDADPRGVVFTSGGSEANSLAIAGLAAQTPAAVALTTPIEHPSVRDCFQLLAARGWTVRHLPVTPDGDVSVDGPTVIDSQVRLVSAMLANNETGVLQPVGAMARQAAVLGVPVHCDAIQAVGKIPVSFRKLGVAALSLSAHKFHGPAGTGALLLDRRWPIQPLFCGGHQEHGLRPGTESVAQAVGLATALAIACRELEATQTRVAALRDRFESAILQRVPGARVNGSARPRVGNTSNICFPGVDGQALMVALDLAGVACSAGAACCSGAPEPSHVLRAMGCSPAHTRSSLRFSFSSLSQEQEVVDAVQRIASVLRSFPTRSSEP